MRACCGAIYGNERLPRTSSGPRTAVPSTTNQSLWRVIIYVPPPPSSSIFVATATRPPRTVVSPEWLSVDGQALNFYSAIISASAENEHGERTWVARSALLARQRRATFFWTRRGNFAQYPIKRETETDRQTEFIRQVCCTVASCDRKLTPVLLAILKILVLSGTFAVIKRAKQELYTNTNTTNTTISQLQ